MISALRDATVESDAYTRAEDRYNIELTVFRSTLGYGIYTEGQDWGDLSNKKKGQPHVAPSKICSFDYSSAWRKYGPPQG
jgi:hypothetical protein